MINKNNNIHTYNIYFLIYAADFRLINKKIFFSFRSALFITYHMQHIAIITHADIIWMKSWDALVPLFVKRQKINFTIKIIWYMKWNWNEFRSNFDASFDKLFPCFVNFFSLSSYLLITFYAYLITSATPLALKNMYGSIINILIDVVSEYNFISQASTEYEC